MRKCVLVKSICSFCELGFSVIPSKIKNNRGKFCSRTCKDRSQIGKRISPGTEIKKGQHLSPSTEFKIIHGRTPEYIKIKNEFRGEWSEWRSKVFSRDNWTCQKCMKKSRKLHPHHIKGFIMYPESRFDLNNGLTVCPPCHSVIESNRRWGNEV